MTFNGMDDFQNTCKRALVYWYNEVYDSDLTYYITIDDVYVVWACKTLQNYKALLSTSANGDGIYVEYTYNGDKCELYQLAGKTPKL